MIERLNEERIPQAEALLKRVFPRRGLVEGRYFWGWRNRGKGWMRALFRLTGIQNLEEAWVDVDEEGRVRGLVGLYSKVRDAREARWVSWFCVDPEVRGQGRGKALLDFVIDQARRGGFAFLRLHTSTVKVMEKAQVLYKSRGFREIDRRSRWGYAKLVRELSL